MTRVPGAHASSPALPQHRRAVTRLTLTALAGVAGATLIPLLLSRPTLPLEVLLFGYVTGAAAYLALVGRILFRTSAADVQQHALIEDPARTTVLLFILGSSAAVIGGAMTLLRRKGSGATDDSLLLALMLASTALAWLVTNAAFALHYAHLHFRGTGGVADAEDLRTGFQFPGDDPPDGMDFAYFAFTIGMTFQVSDVQVRNSACRRTVLAHAMLAFVYNTLLIALVVNTALGAVGH